MDRPLFITVIKESHRKRRATGSIPVVGSSFNNKKQNLMNSDVSKRVPALANKDLTEGRLLTPDQCKTVKVLTPSMLFLTAKSCHLSAFATEVEMFVDYWADQVFRISGKGGGGEVGCLSLL